MALKPKTQVIDEDLIDTVEAAKRIGIKPITLRTWRYEQREDQPKCIKFGRAVRYRPSDVADFIKSRERTF